MGIKWKWTWITSRISPHINSTHKYPVRPNNLPFMYLPSGMAHFIALFPKIRGTTTVHDLGCLWKKTSVRPTKQKDITPSTGTIQSMKSLRAKSILGKYHCTSALLYWSSGICSLSLLKTKPYDRQTFSHSYGRIQQWRKHHFQMLMELPAWQHPNFLCSRKLRKCKYP